MPKKYYKDDQELYRAFAHVRSNEVLGIEVKKQRSGFRTWAEAEKFEKQLMLQAQRELFTKERQQPTWGDLVDEWELALRNGLGSMRMLVKTTQEDYINVLRSFTQTWWKTPSDQITPADVRDVLIQIHESGRSRARQQRVKTAIDGIFKWGIETRKIKGVHASPARGVSLIGRTEEKRPEILTLNEIRKLLKCAKEMNHRFYPIWAMALLTGCRSGELYSLQWEDVDFENKTIMISKSYNKRTNSYGPTKAGYWREVPMSPDLESLLIELSLKRAGKKWVLPHHPEWSSYQQASVLRQFCQEIGIPSIRFHALRACFATQLIKDGIAPSVVMKVCGWRDLKTMQRYIRLAGIEIQGATDTLKILPEKEVYGRVMELFDSNAVN
ncbi:MAG: site-specific integrase [Bdellovibrionales bacterium]|nr:site-specific integrase [Bdellovibrionales bacterium]